MSLVFNDSPLTACILAFGTTLCNSLLSRPDHFTPEERSRAPLGEALSQPGHRSGEKSGPSRNQTPFVTYYVRTRLQTSNIQSTKRAYQYKLATQTFQTNVMHPSSRSSTFKTASHSTCLGVEPLLGLTATFSVTGLSVSVFAINQGL